MRRTYRVRRQTGLNKKSLFPLWRSVPSLCNSVKQLITQSTTTCPDFGREGTEKH